MGRFFRNSSKNSSNIPKIKIPKEQRPGHESEGGENIVDIVVKTMNGIVLLNYHPLLIGQLETYNVQFSAFENNSQLIIDYSIENPPLQSYHIKVNEINYPSINYPSFFDNPVTIGGGVHQLIFLIKDFRNNQKLKIEIIDPSNQDKQADINLVIESGDEPVTKEEEAPLQ